MLHASTSFARPDITLNHQKSPDASSTTKKGSRDVQQHFANASATAVFAKGQSTSARAFDGSSAFHQQGKVADRIRSINNIQATPEAATRTWNRNIPSKQHHPGQPLSIAPGSRALPFVRRGALATPLATSNLQIHDMGLHLHSPTPQRMQPTLPGRIEQGARIDGESIHPTAEPAKIDQASGQPTGRLKQVLGLDHALDSVMCSRHGRQLVSRNLPTKKSLEGLEKTIGGAYVPTGYKLRHQVDAFSPWVMFGKSLAKQEGTTVSPEICPDCIAEHDIWARELSRSLQGSGTGPARTGTGHTTLGPSSIITEPGTPTNEVHSNVMIGMADDHQMLSLPGAAVSGMSLDEAGSIIAADLGDMLDAIIIEHSGTLDKVITNLRDGVVEPARMKKLSEDLVKVSEAVAAVPEDEFRRPPTFVRERGARGKHSMVLDLDPRQLRKRTRSVPELLGFIDAAAEDLGLNLPGIRDDGERLSPSKESDLEPKPGQHHGSRTVQVPGGLDPIVMTPMELMPNTVMPPRRLGGGTIQIPGGLDPIVLTSTESTPSTTMFTPGTTPEPIYYTPLPSEILRSQDLTPLPLPFPTPDLDPPAPPSTVLQTQPQTPRDTVSPPMTTESLSRIPPRKQTPSTSRTAMWSSRSYVGPFQPGSGSKPVLVKPSEVRRSQKAQRTFEQGWLKDAASQERAERVERRGRIGGGAGVLVNN